MGCGRRHGQQADRANPCSGLLLMRTLLNRFWSGWNITILLASRAREAGPPEPRSESRPRAPPISFLLYRRWRWPRRISQAVGMDNRPIAPIRALVLEADIRCSELSGAMDQELLCAQRAASGQPHASATCGADSVASQTYCAGAGMGRMLDTLQPLGVLTSTWFIKNLVCCGGWPAAPIVNRMGT